MSESATGIHREKCVSHNEFIETAIYYKFSNVQILILPRQKLIILPYHGTLTTNNSPQVKQNDSSKLEE